MKLNFFQILYCVSAFMGWQCAALGPPSGGAKDITPPELTSVDPPSGTVNLSSSEIILSFSEYMDEKSFEKGIRIAPVLIGDLELKFKGEKVILTLPENINKDITAVVTLSREIKDEHGVEMSKSVQLAYSFGDKIDKGKINGKVYADSPAALYLFHDDGSDTLLLSSPQYISEAEDDGSFAFNYLAPGLYQVLAIDRGVSGVKLDPSRMAYGVPFVSNIILDTLKTNIHLKLRQEERPLRLLRGEWMDWNWGQIYFNNELSKKISFSDLKIGSTNLNWFHHPDDKTIVVVTTNDSLHTNKESISFSSIQMNESIILDTSNVYVNLSSVNDTNSLSITKPWSDISITPDKTGPVVDVIISRPLQEEIIDNHSMVLLLTDTIDVVIEKNITTPMSMTVLPQDGWKDKSVYTLKIFKSDSSEVKNTFKDSVTTFKISTNRALGYGGLLGSVIGISKNFVAEINHVENSQWKFKSVVNSAGHFEFFEVPEGKYTISIFEDRDKNFSYSFGKAYPFQPSEWFYEQPDSIEIRANWDIELSPILLEK